ERQREPVIVLITRERDTAALEELVKRRTRELCGERNRGHVPTARERLAGFDRPDKIAIEVFRVITMKAVRRILQHAQRVNQSLIDRECEDERLERRTRRAPAARAIDLSGYFRVEKIRRTNFCEHFHAARVDEHGRGIL